MLLSTASEKLATGGITALLGIAMTFIMLGLLILFIYLIEVIIKQLAKLIKKEDKNAVKTEPAPLTEPIQAVPDAVAPALIDDEIMVAIQSALKIYLAESATDNLAHDRVTIKSVTKL